MTSGQPSRISESVPSKSNNTWLMSGRGEKPGRNSTSPLNADLETIEQSDSSAGHTSQPCVAELRAICLEPTTVRRLVFDQRRFAFRVLLRSTSVTIFRPQTNLA